jgi:hypothetical protein
MSDMSRSASMARRRSLPGPRIWSCPTYSERSRGRILQASGAPGCSGSAVTDSIFFERFLMPTVLFQEGLRGQVIVAETGPSQIRIVRDRGYEPAKAM